MANVAVAVVAGAAGAIAGKVMANGKGGKGDDEAVDFAPDGRANAKHADEAKKARYLAQEYPSVDERDEKTPDNWVKRHPGLIRLTGKHPFNVEASLPELIDYGFISPVNLHIVRNHGAVPKLSWETHSIDVCGNVPKPYAIGMDELSKMMPADTFPCLIVCAGNRRKEQNLIKQSVGFSWGPCAVGNTYCLIKSL